MGQVSDVVIVGGGVIGCSLAHHLTAEGLRVTLCERGALGAQSTGRCAGGVRQQFSNPLNVQIQRLSVRMLREFADEVGAPCDFRQIGYLLLLSTAEQVESFRSQLRMWHALGLDEARWLAPQDVCALVPSLRVNDLLGATFCPSDGIASPNDVTHGYAASARRGGARILTDTEVLAVEVEGGRVRGVSTSRGRIAAPQVVNCAGAWAPAVVAGLGIDLPVVPIRRHIFLTAETPAVPPDTPMTVDISSTFYFHPESGGALFGMGEPNEAPSFDLEVDWGLLEQIQPVAERRVPQLLEAGIRTAWVGLYEVTPDHNPFIGPLPEPEGLWTACGFSGHGFQQAPVVGRVLAQMMTGRECDLDLSPFSPTRDLAGSLPEANVI